MFLSHTVCDCSYLPILEITAEGDRVVEHVRRNNNCRGVPGVQIAVECGSFEEHVLHISDGRNLERRVVQGRKQVMVGRKKRSVREKVKILSSKK